MGKLISSLGRYIGVRKLPNQGFLLVKLKSSLRKFYGRHHDLVDRYGISDKWPRICSTCRKNSPVLSLFMTYHWRKPWWEPQALEYPINWEIYTPYAGAAGMLLDMNGKFTMGNWNHLFCGKVSYVCFVDRCLSVLLRYTDYDYPFSMSKLFLAWMKRTVQRPFKENQSESINSNL
jgi:hypothetical protein